MFLAVSATLIASIVLVVVLSATLIGVLVYKKYKNKKDKK